MCKFIQIIVNNPSYFEQNLHYIPDIERCYCRYSKYIHDDFSHYTDIIHFIYTLQPCFWVITDRNGVFAGFAYLDNFVGDKNRTYSAEITTCFDKKAWGSFTRYSANIFLRNLFLKTGLTKLKAQIYPDNFRVKNYLKDVGFTYETTLKNETVRGGKLQDIEVYAIYRNYYNNKRG